MRPVPAKAQKDAESFALTKSIARSTLFGALWVRVALFDTSFLVVDLDMTYVKPPSIASIPVDSFFPREVPTDSAAKSGNAIPRLNRDDCA
mmetsp:Transcript_32808/g.96740  ORF Transcript_32808/g.96740 Transcript_32808/m.96740 type:complete len:91 (-) Transcript_32808:10552-10824(-)